jgi:hypothetical protein
VRGPSGEPLWIDAAISPAQPRARTLVVSSGLHGVEGFFGSAVQVALLERWRVAPPRVRCVLLHALNPFGFAWLRRTDERNVDLNRNFLLDGEPFAGAPAGYAALDPVLNPTDVASASRSLFFGLLPSLIRSGVADVRRAVAIGQYEFPRGLFFGGAAPSPTRVAIERVMRSSIGGASSVVHLDLHTGLGKWSVGQLLIDYAISNGLRERMVRGFGADRIRMAATSDLAYTARGGFGRWCVSAGLAAEYLFAYAEFGTFSGLRVLSGLRAENQAHHWLDAGDPAAARAKGRLRDLFFPPNRAWRSRTIDQAMDLTQRAETILMAAT